MTPASPRADGTSPKCNALIDPGHLPSTYTSLLVLGILRAPLEEWVDKLDVDGLERLLDTCADSNGSFSPIPLRRPDSAACPPTESPPFQSDARMAYCAAVIEDMLSRAKYPESTVSGRAVETGAAASSSNVGELSLPGPRRRSRSRTREWLTACQTWEGGFGQHPGLEAQGGTTYCAIASLRLHSSPRSADGWHSGIDVDAATRYLVSRQLGPEPVSGQEQLSREGGGGFQGRPGKLEDVCYSFWCGGAMRLLLGKAMFDTDANSRALLDAQSPLGGFGKAKGDRPDPFHSYLAIAALAMNENEVASSERLEDAKDTERRSVPKIGLKTLDPLWNVSAETRSYIEECLQGILRRKYVRQEPAA